METVIQRAAKLLLDHFKEEYDCVLVSEEDGHYRVKIETSNSSLLIGRRGAVLEALQTLLKNIFWAQNGENIFISIDVDGYRKAQEDSLLAKMDKIIQKMKEKNVANTKTFPMNSYLRRVVHLWIAKQYPELTTESEGKGEEKAMKIFYK